MSELFLEYGLFLAQTITIVVAIIIVVVFVTQAARDGEGSDHLQVRNLNEKFDELTQGMRRELISKKAFKAEAKARKKAAKAEAKAGQKASEEAIPDRKRVFVIEFKGDIKATAVAALREEVTAVLTAATDQDEVVVRLENPGGLVHEHGLAASQLQRIRAQAVPLTVIVDKVAASGGYMMACVANKIVAAPFAVLGSIGVLMQLPNFHRLLDSHGVDFEMLKGGQYKRTLTMFGENSEEDRAKSQEEIDAIHDLFKDYVHEHRPQLDLEKVATGEHWHGRAALELALCDELSTSDDYLMAASRDSDVFELKFAAKKPLSRKFADAMGAVTDTILLRLGTREQESRILK